MGGMKSKQYLCQVWVFGLLLQKINKTQAELHHKVSELRLQSLVELVGVPPNQLVHRLSHHVQTWLWSVGVAPGLFQNKPVDSFEILPKLQPARLQSFGLLAERNVNLCHTLGQGDRVIQSQQKLRKGYLSHLRHQLAPLKTRFTPAR